MSPRSVLITGANRGIGFEFVREFLKTDNPPEIIITTCRNIDQATALKELAKNHPSVKILQLEVTNYDQFDSVAKQVEEIVGKENGLNLLINNAGIAASHEDGLTKATVKSMLECFEVNCVAPIMFTRALMPLIQTAAGTKPNEGKSYSRAGVFQVSSIMSSIQEVDTPLFGGAKLPLLYAYRCSKTALNMGTKCLAVDFKNDGIIFGLLHPGWVKTDMGGSAGELEIYESARMMIETMKNFKEEDNGELIAYDGKKLKW